VSKEESRQGKLPKIALCLSGAPRFNNEALELFLGSLRSYSQCDIFAYIWHSSRYEDLCITKKLLGLSCDKINVATVEFPQEYLVNADHEYVKLNPTKVENLYKMYHGIKMCNNLVSEYSLKNNVSYDYVIRSRSDLILSKVFDLNDYIEIMADHLVLPGNGWGEYNINDQYAVGKPHLMDIYSSTIDFIDYYTQLPEPGILMYPETLLGEHLVRNGVSILRDNFQSLLVRD